MSNDEKVFFEKFFYSEKINFKELDPEKLFLSIFGISYNDGEVEEKGSEMDEKIYNEICNKNQEMILEEAKWEIRHACDYISCNFRTLLMEYEEDRTEDKLNKLARVQTLYAELHKKISDSCWEVMDSVSVIVNNEV